MLRTAFAIFALPLLLFSASEWEQQARAIPAAANIRATVQKLSSQPHLAGTPASKQTAEWILAQLRQYGLDANIETFEALLPTPQERVLEMTAPTLPRQTPGAGGRGRSRLREPRHRAALQRVFRQWRRDRAARLCQLRRARRLRHAKGTGHRRARENRHRALWRELSRRETARGL